MRFLLPTLAIVALASPAFADEPKEEKKGKEDTEAQVPKEEKSELICRHIRLEMSSRRKERVCLTKDGWKEFNRRN